MHLSRSLKLLRQGSAGVLLAVLMLTLPASANDRFVFVIYQKPPAAAQSGLTSWVSLLDNGSRSLLEGVKQSSFSLVVSPQEVTNRANNTLEKWFQTRPSLFAVWVVPVPKNQDIYIDNEIYVGDLKGDLPSSYLHFSQTIQPVGYRISRDATAIVTLYTYAMSVDKALKLGTNRHPVCLPLQRANLYANDLDAATRKDLMPLITAIRGNLKKLRCAG